MKSKISVILLFSMLGTAGTLCAQTDKQKQDEAIGKQRLEESLARGNNKRMQARAIELQVQESKYNNREQEILAKLNTETIPSDFPVYKPEFTNEEYTSLMDKWYTANPSLVKTKKQ